MKVYKRNKRWTAMVLIFMVAFGLLPGGYLLAAGAEVLDQAQNNYEGNNWVNKDSPKFQTFEPGFSGNLSRVEIYSAGSYGATGALKVSIFKETDLSTPLASQLAILGAGWISIDFSGAPPYLKRNLTYRMVVSTENGGSAGFGWYTFGGNPYPRGRSSTAGYDFTFRTYMIPDYSLSPDESKVTIANNRLVADGASQTTVTVTLKDAQGNALTSGGAAVVIASTLGTVGAVTDNGDGTYTATLMAPTTTGTATVSASVGGGGIESTANVQFVPGAASAAKSTVSVGSTTLTADGAAQTPVTVKLKDAQGNALTSGGSAVVIASTLGTVGAVTDNGDGTYTATLKAPTTTGPATVSASVGGSWIVSTANVQFVPGAESAAKSTISVGSGTLIADGAAQTPVTVKLKDAQGNALTSGGATVVVASTLGTVGAVTDNGDGTYTATLTAPTTTGTATVSASVGGSGIASTANVQFVPGAASTIKSTVVVGSSTLTADGAAQTPVTVKLKDAQGNALTSGGAAVALTSTLGTVGTVTDNQDGTYQATLTAPTTVGDATVSASVGGSGIASTASVQFVPGAASTANSTVEAGDTTLTADGAAQTPVTVKLKDAQGNALTSGGSTIAVTSTLGTVGTVTDNQDGTYQATLTAPTTVGNATISASVGGGVIASTATVQFVLGEVSISRSTMTASDLVVRADGSSKSTIFVKLKDDYDHPIAGKRVLLQANGGQSVITDVYGPTDAEGRAVFTVSNTMAETVTYFAREAASGHSLNQNVNIAFTYDQPPHITLQANPIEPTFGSVTVTVSTYAYGDFNGVSSVKWAAGSHPSSYFADQGTEINDHFVVQENGIYSVYVADTAGNANVSLIDIRNMMPLSSNANLTDWQLTGLGGTILFHFDPAITSSTVNVSQAVYGLTMQLTPSDVYSAVYVNGSQITSNLMTSEFPLAIGRNSFEVTVKAQDGAVKTYMLYVIRTKESHNSDSTSSSNGASPSTGNSPMIWINAQGVSGIATLQTDTNGVKFIDVLLNAETLKKVLDSLPTETEMNLSISIEEKTDKAVLRLPSEAISLFAKKAVTILFETSQGQYRLPLSEVASQESGWANNAEVQIMIEHSHSEEISGLQEAAKKGKFQLVGDPVQFHVYAVRQGEKKELTRFNRYIERVIFLPPDFVGKPATAAVWDQKLGIRPVPTKFTKVAGRQAAEIRSLTNSTYMLVDQVTHLTDIQGHWAAAEISDLNRRMIVQGADESRFVPKAEITRAELAALLARALGLPEEGGRAGFQDVSDSSWYSGSVVAVKAYGIMDGVGAGTFRPDQKVSRQEAIVTIVRALRLAGATAPTSSEGVKVDLASYADHDQIADWASDAIRIAIHDGLVQGYGDELRPQQSLTRAETTVLLYRMLQKAGLINK